jgi:hypothetical protein
LQRSGVIDRGGVVLVEPPPARGSLVTISELRAALRATVGRRGMTEDDIWTLADYVISFFGFDSEVIDNRLDMDDRDVFYMLEEGGLLGTRQEEVHIKKGKLWRIHYWILRTRRIKELAGRSKPVHEAGVFTYDDLPAEAWARDDAEDDGPPA